MEILIFNKREDKIQTKKFSIRCKRVLESNDLNVFRYLLLFKLS